MNEDVRYRQLLRFASETVWAVLPSTLWTIRELLSMRLQGVRLDRSEVEARIAGGRARPDAANGGGVAVVPLWGVLVPHAGMMVDVSTPGTGLDEWAQQFMAAVADPAVSTVVIQVNSPGGSAGGVTETAKIVRDARSQKRIVSVADGLCASAAFAIASQADEFIATPSGMVGAVHCYSIHEDISAALEQEGTKLTLIGAPDNGSAETPPFLPLSEENLAHAQRTVDQFYERFVSDVAMGRGVDASTVEASYGRGRVLTAKDAKAAGMIDGIGTLDDTVARMLQGKTAAGSTRQLAVAAAAAPNAADVYSLSGTGGFVAGVSGAVTLALEGAAPLHGFPPDWYGDDQNDLHHDNKSQASERAAATTHTEGAAMEPVTIDGRPATLEELAAQQTHLEGEIDDLLMQAEGKAFTAEQQDRFNGLEKEHLEIGQTIANIEDRDRRRAKLAGDKTRHIAGDGPGVQIPKEPRGPRDIYDLSAYRAHARSVEDLAPLWRDGAKRANEKAAYSTKHQDETRAFVEALLNKDGSNRPHDSFAHRMLITANPAYDAAFGRWVMGRESNADMNVIRMAVTNTGLSTETPVPVTIDPTVLYTGDGARSPLREMARVVTITGLKWRGIGSDGVTLSYGAEDAAINPATPTFDAPDVEVIPARGEIQFSVDVEGDWPALRSELQLMFSQAKFRLEADKFLNGTGTGEPTGLIWAIDDDGGSVVDTATMNVLALQDVIDLSDALPSAFDFNASWLAHKSFYSNVAALAAAAGRIDVWVPLSGGFNQQSGNSGYKLLNSGAYTASEISKVFDTGGEEVAVIGDFAQGFVIVDRVGLNVELDPHPRDGNGKWTGNRGLVCWFRNNTSLRTPNAFRLLRIKS